MLIFKKSKPFSITLCMLTVCVFGACSQQGSVITVKDKNTVVCQSYKPTNNRIPIKDCGAQGERDEIRWTAQKSLDASASPITNNPKGG